MHLNGSSIGNLRSYQSKSHEALLGLTFDHDNNTVCWINHANVTSTMRCALATDLTKFWDKPDPYLYSFEGEFNKSKCVIYILDA